MLFNLAARRRIDQLEAKVKQLTEQRDQLAEALETQIATAEQLMSRAFLVDFTRNGRENIITFVRNGEFTQIKQMGLLSDDIEAWKRKLIE